LARLNNKTSDIIENKHATRFFELVKNKANIGNERKKNHSYRSVHVTPQEIMAVCPKSLMGTAPGIANNSHDTIELIRLSPPTLLRNQIS
jgi:hypothetical protein